MPTDGDELSRALRQWAEADGARAIHPSDHEAVRATEAARALVLSLVRSGGDPRDLFTACATLGRLLADGGASPSLASATMDGAASALRAIGAASPPPGALAALLEGYVGAVVAAERASARRAWEWPACAVPLDDRTCAITACYPEGPDDALVAWAERVATRASKAGVRRAVVAGEGRPRAELEAALAVVGVEVLARLPEEPRSWLPWRRSK